MEFHPIANIFPLISGKEFEDLKQDILANGVHEPVVLYEGKILDGRNRFFACREAGVTPDFVEYKGVDPVGYVISLNLFRRHLASDQRAAAAVDALPLYEAEAKKRQLRTAENRSLVNQKIDEQKNTQASQQVAEIFSTNRQYVSDMKKIKEESPETFEAIKQGEKRLVEVKKEKIRAERIERIAEISSGNSGLSADRLYPVIYADPPWRYDYSETAERDIENQYPTMSLEEICNLQIPSTKDAVLFLWATAPKLIEGLEVLKAWGFSYRTCAIWDKQKMGMGYYFRIQHELLLIGTRGSIPTPEPANRPRSVISIPYTGHSEKPSEIAEMIEAMYPELPKLEMFCRNPRDGWDVWGNQSGA